MHIFEAEMSLARSTWRDFSEYPQGNRFQNIHFSIINSSKQLKATDKCSMVGK